MRKNILMNYDEESTDEELSWLMNEVIQKVKQRALRGKILLDATTAKEITEAKARFKLLKE